MRVSAQIRRSYEWRRKRVKCEIATLFRLGARIFNRPPVRIGVLCVVLNPYDRRDHGLWASAAPTSASLNEPVGHAHGGYVTVFTNHAVDVFTSHIRVMARSFPRLAQAPRHKPSLRRPVSVSCVPMNAADAERDIEHATPEEIAASLQPRLHGATVLVGPGQYSPYAGHQRVTVLVVDHHAENKPHVIWDRFLPTHAIAPLCEALRAYAHEVCPGEFDTMYGTPWSYAWTTPPNAFRLYDEQGLLLAVQHDEAVFRRENTMTLVPLPEIVQVVGWLSPDWCERGVRIDVRQGKPLAVAEQTEPMAHLDPTYDGINLMCDAAWVGRLGKTIAKGLGVAYVPEDSALA